MILRRILWNQPVTTGYHGLKLSCSLLTDRDKFINPLKFPKGQGNGQFTKQKIMAVTGMSLERGVAPKLLWDGRVAGFCRETGKAKARRLACLGGGFLILSEEDSSLSACHVF